MGTSPRRCTLCARRGSARPWSRHVSSSSSCEGGRSTDSSEPCGATPVACRLRAETRKRHLWSGPEALDGTGCLKSFKKSRTRSSSRSNMTSERRRDNCGLQRIAKMESLKVGWLVRWFNFRSPGRASIDDVYNNCLACDGVEEMVIQKISRSRGFRDAARLLLGVWNIIE